jgi:pyruvate dehydrogenase E1 component
MPALPASDAVQEGIVKGAYCWQPRQDDGEAIELLASGSLMQQAILAADQLRKLGYAPAIWSVTSYIELAREAEACERQARLNPTQPRQQPYVESLFGDLQCPIIAVTDYQKGLPASISRWMPPSYTVLGTDGFGVSESRPDLRDHFEVSVDHIVQAALVQLYRLGLVGEQELREQLEPLGIDPGKLDPVSR